jgi:hypothetical protein
MNVTTLILAATPDLGSLLITFLVLIVVICIIGGLIWAIETYIMKQAIPGPIKLIIGLILIVLVIIWGIKMFGGG